jgi:hypothetical protein
MITRELLHQEIDQLDEKHLDEVYTLIQKLLQNERGKPRSKSLLKKLQEIKVEGPSDWSVNHELN